MDSRDIIERYMIMIMTGSSVKEAIEKSGIGKLTLETILTEIMLYYED